MFVSVMIRPSTNSITWIQGADRQSHPANKLSIAYIEFRPYDGNVHTQDESSRHREAIDSPKRFQDPELAIDPMCYGTD